jgi:hypothetical protein
MQSAEIFALTYGSLVRQLILDFEDLEEVSVDCVGASTKAYSHLMKYATTGQQTARDDGL